MDLAAIKADLEQAVRECDATLATLAAEEADGLADGPEDAADEATELIEADLEEALVESTQLRREEALAALARISDGTFGTCIECGEQIPAARLEFRPEAARCLACQEAFEEAEG